MLGPCIRTGTPMLYMRPSESATRAVYTCDHCFYGGQFAAAGARRGRAAVPRRPGRRVRHPGGSQTPPWRRGVVNAGVFATRARPGSGTAGTPTAGGAHAAPLTMRCMHVCMHACMYVCLVNMRPYSAAVPRTPNAFTQEAAAPERQSPRHDHAPH